MGLAIATTMDHGLSLWEVGGSLRMLHGIDVAVCSEKEHLARSGIGCTPRPNFPTNPEPETSDPA